MRFLQNIQGCLTSRRECVKLTIGPSDQLLITYDAGVTQGSVLGPTLFLLQDVNHPVLAPLVLCQSMIALSQKQSRGVIYNRVILARNTQTLMTLLGYAQTSTASPNSTLGSSQTCTAVDFTVDINDLVFTYGKFSGKPNICNIHIKMFIFIMHN